MDGGVQKSPLGKQTMSMIRPIAWLATVVVVLGMASHAGAQGIPGPPGNITQPGSLHFWEFQPFLDPKTFAPDFQFFAPAEVNDFGGEEVPNYGLYITFDRTYVNVSRPSDQFSFGSEHQGDFTWGNRMEAGYMVGDPKGWQAVLWHVNGPNESFVNEEFNQFVTNLDGSATGQVLAAGAVDTINRLKLSDFQLNRVWRMKPLHNGAIFEPLIGYRYMNVKDFYQREFLTQAILGAAPRADANDEFFERFTSRTIFENQMHGGQLGGRLFQQRGHWMLSCEVKMFAVANFQSLRYINERSILPNPDILQFDGDTADLVGFYNNLGHGGDLFRTTNYNKASQFVWGGEVRAEAAYELTRDVNLRFGMVFFDLAQGIGRGNTMTENNQGVVMAGVTFGFTVNR